MSMAHIPPVNAPRLPQVEEPPAPQGQPDVVQEGQFEQNPARWHRGEESAIVSLSAKFGRVLAAAVSNYAFYWGNLGDSSNSTWLTGKAVAYSAGALGEQAGTTVGRALTGAEAPAVRVVWARGEESAIVRYSAAAGKLLGGVAGGYIYKASTGVEVGSFESFLGGELAGQMGGTVGEEVGRRVGTTIAGWMGQGAEPR